MTCRNSRRPVEYGKRIILGITSQDGSCDEDAWRRIFFCPSAHRSTSPRGFHIEPEGRSIGDCEREEVKSKAFSIPLRQDALGGNVTWTVFTRRLPRLSRNEKVKEDDNE